MFASCAVRWTTFVNVSTRANVKNEKYSFRDIYIAMSKVFCFADGFFFSFSAFLHEKINAGDLIMTNDVLLCMFRTPYEIVWVFSLQLLFFFRSLVFNQLTLFKLSTHTLTHFHFLWNNWPLPSTKYILCARDDNE